MRALIVGFGSAGRRHFKNLQRLGVSDILVYRTGKGVLNDREEGASIVSDMSQVIASKPDFAVIANPTSMHVSSALALAKAGCHLLIEKPLSNDLEKCDELVREIGRRGLVAAIGFQFRFHPLLRSLKRQLSEGRLGTCLSAAAEWGEHLEDWHPWEDHRLSYAAQSTLGGGTLLTLCHPLDYLSCLFGEIVDIKAMTRKSIALGTEVGDDISLALIRFSSGVLADLRLDFIQRPPVHRLSVIGEKGRVACDFLAGQMTWRSHSGADDVEVAGDFSRNDMFLAEMEHFLDCIKTQRAPEVTVEAGVRNLKAILRAKQDAEATNTHG